MQLSSVYVFYDPAFAFLSLGTLTALHEIALTARLAPLGIQFCAGDHHARPMTRT